jgi:hypothetical protein
LWRRDNYGQFIVHITKFGGIGKQLASVSAPLLAGFVLLLIGHGIQYPGGVYSTVADTYWASACLFLGIGLVILSVAASIALIVQKA